MVALASHVFGIIGIKRNKFSPRFVPSHFEIIVALCYKIVALIKTWYRSLSIATIITRASWVNGFRK